MIFRVNMMKVIFAAYLLFLALGQCDTAGADQARSVPLDQQQRIDYSLGNQLGNDMRRIHVEIQRDAFLQGIRDALAGKPPRIDKPSMDKLLGEVKRRLRQRQQLTKRQAVADVRARGDRFRAENATVKGVTTTPSGLQYQILSAGKGAKPGPKDQVVIDYVAKRADGMEFNSTYRRGQPETYRLDKLIPGLTEAIGMMREGAKWRIVLPPELAFARHTPLEDRTVIYTLTLRKVIPEQAAR